MFLLTACGAEHNPLFIEGGAAKPTIGWRECPHSKQDGITEVALYEWDGSSTVDEPGELLWHIKADRSGPSSRNSRSTPLSQQLVLGTTPDGFTTEHPLTAELTATSTYAVRANMTSDDLVSGFLTFRPEQLSADRVVFSESETESRRDYDDRDDEEFGCFAG